MTQITRVRLAVAIYLTGMGFVAAAGAGWLSLGFGLLLPMLVLTHLPILSLFGLGARLIAAIEKIRGWRR